MKILDLLNSRKFWAALVGFVLTIVTFFVPNFPLTDDTIIAFIMIVVSYIFGTAIDPGAPFGNKILALLASTKFWTAVVGIVFVFVSPQFGITPEMVIAIIVPLIGFIFGKAFADRREYLDSQG